MNLHQAAWHSPIQKEALGFPKQQLEQSFSSLVQNLPPANKRTSHYLRTERDVRWKLNFVFFLGFIFQSICVGWGVWDLGQSLNISYSEAIHLIVNCQMISLLKLVRYVFHLYIQLCEQREAKWAKDKTQGRWGRNWNREIGRSEALSLWIRDGKLY